MDPTGRGFVLSRQAECCWSVEATLYNEGLQQGSSINERGGLFLNLWCAARAGTATAMAMGTTAAATLAATLAGERTHAQ